MPRGEERLADRVIDVYTRFIPPGYGEAFAVLGRAPGTVRRIASKPDARALPGVA